MSELNQIEEIEKLYAKPKSYKVPENPKKGQSQVTINIMPLGFEDMGLMNVKKDSSTEEISKNVISLWAISLQIDEEKAKKISVEFMEDLMSAFMDANNFKEEDMKKTGINDFVEKKQQQIKEQKEKGDVESNKSA